MFCPRLWIQFVEYRQIFRVSGNLFSLKDLLTHFVSSLKQNSKFFNMSTGVSPAVPLSEGKFFTIFVTVFPKTDWKNNFLFILTLCFILSILGCLEKLAMIYSILSLLVKRFSESVTDSKYVWKVLAILWFSETVFN